MATSCLLRMVCGPKKSFVNVISKSEGEPITYDDFTEAGKPNIDLNCLKQRQIHSFNKSSIEIWKVIEFFWF